MINGIILSKILVDHSLGGKVSNSAILNCWLLVKFFSIPFK